MQLRGVLLLVVLVACGVLLVVLLVDGATSLAPRGPQSEPPRVGDEQADRALRDRRRRGAVGVARSDTHGRFACGALLGRDLVLTCRHSTQVHSSVLERRAPTDLEVHLDVVLDAANEAGTAYRAFPVLEYAYTSERHDYCLLRLGPDGSGRLPEADRVLALSTERATLDVEIYVAHLPRGGALVIDDGSVRFPYEATSSELQLMATRLGALPDRGTNEVEELWRSYRPQPSGLFVQHSVRWAGQPTIGAECDTVDGSSGAPVFLARTHALVGIVFAGGDPSAHRGHGTWTNHEAVLPSPVILDDLTRAGRGELLAR